MNIHPLPFKVPWPSASPVLQLMPGLTVRTFTRQSHQVTTPHTHNSLAVWDSVSGQDPKTEASSFPHQWAGWLFHKLSLVPGPLVFLKAGVLPCFIGMLVHIITISIFKKPCSASYYKKEIKCMKVC